MKNLILVLVSIILLILDNSLTPFIAVKGAYPSLLFIFSICHSIIRGKEEGVKIGVIGGLLQDIFFANTFGVNALINMLVCYFTSVIGEGIWKQKRFIPMVTMFIASIAKLLGVTIILYFLNVNVEIVRGIYVAIYNSIIMFCIYGLVYKHYNKDAKQISWRFKVK